MSTVELRVVPKSRHFDGITCHWHSVLYQHCSKLAIGEMDIDFLLSVLKEAEDEENQLVTNAIYKLFYGQLEWIIV